MSEPPLDQVGGSRRPALDVLIVGGGIGGLSAAIAFGSRGARVTVLERDGRTDGANIGFNYRALYALRELGILDQIVERGTSYAVGAESRFEAMYRADGQRIQTVSAPEVTDDYEMPITSVRLPRPMLAEFMRDAAQVSGAELLVGHTYRSLKPGPDGIIAEFTNGERRHHDLVVGADGIHSGLRQRLFPESGETTYLGVMNFRVMFEGTPTDWRGGHYVAPDGSERLITHAYPDGRFHVATGMRMDRRHVDPQEARAIIRNKLEPFVESAEMFKDLYARVTKELQVIVTPVEWVYVEPPWHRGRIVLLGDALHGTAPTIGSGGQMAMEDSLVLAEELALADDIEAGLTAYADRRQERAKLVAETSARLMGFDNEPESQKQAQAIRRDALQALIAPY